MSDVYKGSSESAEQIINGYIDYAMEVIASRAIPDLRDGLKPVTRRIIYASSVGDTGRLRKCTGVVGDALKLHPHGDTSVYEALTLLTDENGTLNVPFFHGMGNLGKVYLADGPAAMRYPKVQINEAGKDFFKDSEAIDYIPSEEGEGMEPKVLPARYPNVLVNGSEGIAVATGTKLPSFNLGDVLDLTCKYIENGDLTLEDMIVPDFPTGGILVRDDTELAKIMLTGKGKLKIRSKVEIEGRNILVKEIPIGKTVEGIIKSIEKATDIQDIKQVTNCVGRDSTSMIRITCKANKSVEGVLLQLYRKNILQNTFASNILVIEDGEPQIIGVYDLIKHWVSWRKKVLHTKFSKLLEGLKPEKAKLSYFIELCDNQECKEEYVRRLINENKRSCCEYLESIFPDLANETMRIDIEDWIYDRKGSAFNRGGTYRGRYETVLQTEKDYEVYLADLDAYIVNELREIKRQRSAEGFCDRKTEATYKDYKFSKVSNTNEVEDTSFAVYTLRKDGFLIKSRYSSENPDNVLCEIQAQANSVLIGFDNAGRLLRVVGKEIPFTKSGGEGIYLPKYFGVESDVAEKTNYKILYLCELDGSRKMLVYRDGYIGFLDTSEYVGKRNTKIINNGVCLAVMDKLLEIYEEDEIPEYILLADDTGARLKMGIVPTANVPVRSNMSRAKVLSGTDIDSHYLKGFNNFELVRFISNTEDIMCKMKVFKGEFYGNPEEVDDGKYLEICSGLNV